MFSPVAPLFTYRALITACFKALYRATGQAYKPVPPKQSTVAPKAQGFQDKASKHGMDEIILVSVPHITSIFSTPVF